jgi:hypothetical protein
MAVRLSRNMVACLIGELPHGPCLHIALSLSQDMLARARSYLLHSRLAALRGGDPRAGAAFYRREEARARAARPGYGSSVGHSSGMDVADWGWCSH